MIELGSERLRVEMSSPGTFYRGTRFDWSGFITGVTLDGQHTFCAPESLEAGVGSGGFGLCSEFGLFRPVGYESAGVGDWFPKFGVGLLRRPDRRRYQFDTVFELESFPLTVHQEQNQVTFQFNPIPCRGYAAKITKVIRVQDNRLSVAYEFQNTGSERIQTHEYNHNFLAINGTDPGPEYSLELESALELEQLSPGLTREGNRIGWTKRPKMAHMCRTPQWLGHRAETPVWKLTHQPSGVGMSESVDYPVGHVALWFAPHVLSPEVFVDLDIGPGQTTTWTREYHFFNKADALR